MTKPKVENPLSREMISLAITSASGNISVAAQRLGIERYKLQKEIEKSPALQKLVEDNIESLVDLAETSIRQLCLRGEPGSVKFVLETQGRDRGWGKQEKLEITGADGGPVSFAAAVKRKLLKQLASSVEGEDPQLPVRE